LLNSGRIKLSTCQPVGIIGLLRSLADLIGYVGRACSLHELLGGGHSSHSSDLTGQQAHLPDIVAHFGLKMPFYLYLSGPKRIYSWQLCEDEMQYESNLH